MTYNGQTLANSFIDSGSNGIYFTDTSVVEVHGHGSPTSIVPPTRSALGL